MNVSEIKMQYLLVSHHSAAKAFMGLGSSHLPAPSLFPFFAGGFAGGSASACYFFLADGTGFLFDWPAQARGKIETASHAK
jgi:hypothetical protein